MSRRATRCSSLRLVGASRNPDQFSSLGSHPMGWKPPVILGWPLIHGSPSQLISIRWERKRHKDWECCDSPNRKCGLSGMLSGTQHRSENRRWWHWITASWGNTYTDLHIAFWSTKAHNKYPVYVHCSCDFIMTTYPTVTHMSLKWARVL